MCASIVQSVTNSRAAMARFDIPLATSPNFALPLGEAPASLRPRAPSPVHHAARARRSASAMMASPHRIASVPQTEPSLLGYGNPLPWKLRKAIDDAP